MDSIRAFAMGQMSQDREPMVFDWDKAARLIKERNPREVNAGLHSDWEWTGGNIYRDGKPNFEDYTYLASTWATPEIELDGEIEDCYKMKSELPDWNANTKWPDSSLKILNGALSI